MHCGIDQAELGREVVDSVRDLMQATKLKVIAHEGKITDQVKLADNPVRLGATTLAAQIAPVLSSRTEGGRGETNVQINVGRALPPCVGQNAR